MSIFLASLAATKVTDIDLPYMHPEGELRSQEIHKLLSERVQQSVVRDYIVSYHVATTES